MNNNRLFAGKPVDKMNKIDLVEQTQVNDNLPHFTPGTTVNVHYRVREGEKERIQQYEGVVINVRGSGANKTFTVRKISNNVGVERVFPFYSPFIAKLEIRKVGKVRRAKLFYLRDLRGKAARLKEKA
jgi:large subunit ribosomal protein L19